MQPNFRNLTNLLILLISLAGWWITAFMIDPELHYFLRQSAFLTDSQFFQSFTRYPGGLADYISEFISQFFYFKIFGSFLIILVATLLGIIAIELVQRIAGKVKLNFVIFSIILLLSVLIQSNYHYPFYASVRLLLTFGFVWIFSILLKRSPRWRFLYSFFGAILLFYLAGGAALFVFTVSIILIQIRFSARLQDFLILLLIAVISGIIPLVAYKYIFLVNFPLLYAITHSETPKIMEYTPDFELYTLYSILPAYFLCALVFYKFQHKPEQFQSLTAEIETTKSRTKKSAKKIEKEKGKVWIAKMRKSTGKIVNTTAFILSGQLSVIILLAIYFLNQSIDYEKRNQLFVSFYCANRDWDNVINTAKGLDKYDLFTNVEYNMALANTGKLTENLFSYEQLAGSAGLFLDGSVTSDVPFICSDQYYDLGFMHESQHWTFEAQTIFPNSPRLMKRLVQINLVNGKYKLAEKFLRSLSKNMLYHDWVSKYQKFIEDTLLVAKDPEFLWKRKCEPLENFTAKNYQEKLVKLLEANPSNKMAYEYLASSSLLDGDLVTFKNLITENRNILRYPLPRSWDEALVVYNYVSRNTPRNDDIKTSVACQKRFISFVSAFKPFGNDWHKARKSLQNDFGTTYWYYLKCLSPNVTKVQIKQQKFDD